MAAREGFRSIEHVKRYTTTGMATDQGKTSNINALAIVADRWRRAGAAGRADDVPHALYAGDVRHLRRAARGATCSIRCGRLRCTRGPKRRARCSRMSAHGSGRAIFPATARRMPTAVARECLAVRTRGGAVRWFRPWARSRWSGPTPAEFLDRHVHRHDWTKLAPSAAAATA